MFMDILPGDGEDLLPALGRGLGAMANLLTTVAGAPSAKIAPRLSGRHQYKGYSDDKDQSRRYMAAARSRLDASLASLRERREERMTQARMASMEQERHLKEQREERAAHDAEERRELSRRRVAAEERRAAAAAEKGRRKSSSIGNRGGSFTWVEPSTGRRYSVAKNVWDKSAHTLFQMVVDQTRPTPDSRGYPSVEEWRRHCYDTYSGRDRRESYIIRHLPEGGSALDYFKRLTE